MNWEGHRFKTDGPFFFANNVNLAGLRYKSLKISLQSFFNYICNIQDSIQLPVTLQKLYLKRIYFTFSK